MEETHIVTVEPIDATHAAAVCNGCPWHWTAFGEPKAVIAAAEQHAG